MLTVQTLLNTLLTLVDQGMAQAEVRIGDQIEAGPYLHSETGGVWTSRPGDNGESPRAVILCASDADDWREEYDNDFPVGRQDELPLLWCPPAPDDAAPKPEQEVNSGE